MYPFMFFNNSAVLICVCLLSVIKRINFLNKKISTLFNTEIGIYYLKQKYWHILTERFKESLEKLQKNVNETLIINITYQLIKIVVHCTIWIRRRNVNQACEWYAWVHWHVFEVFTKGVFTGYQRKQFWEEKGQVRPIFHFF